MSPPLHRCRQCRRELPHTEEHFRRDARKSSGLRGTCRECENVAQNAARAQRRARGEPCEVEGCRCPRVEGALCHRHAWRQRNGEDLSRVRPEDEGPMSRLASGAIAYRDGEIDEEEVFRLGRSFGAWARRSRYSPRLAPGSYEVGDPHPLLLKTCRAFAEAESDAEFLAARGLLHLYALRLERWKRTKGDEHESRAA